MTSNVNISREQPRVFISYARADGEQYAQSLRKRIEKEHIPLWQDRVSLEGGRDWWLQIEEALEHVEFMVMVMTPAALQSPIVRKEWRTARQKGVCVYPIKAHANIDFTSLPRWMRDIHWYDPDREWIKFVNDLNTRCEQKRVPFMVEELPDDFVERPEETEALIKLLLDTQLEEPVAITAALRGAGGYGKTTMARAICHNERIQEAFDDGILWVTLGENPGDLVGKVKDLIYILSHESPGLSGIDAATAYLAELLANRDILLVIDDVWNGAHLRPFLQGGEHCARLVTTRDEGVLPRIVQRIQVDAMHQDQAVQLLCAGLDDTSRSVEETRELYRLAARLGEWPLLLTLVNSALREKIDRGQHLRDALNYINKVLERRGLTAFDAQNAHERSQAVSKTFDVSFDLLSANDRLRFMELAIFPEDTDIPLVTVQTLWGATGGLDDIDTEDTCDRLYRLSLLLRYDLAMRTIRLHDVVRTYLQQEVGKEGLQVFHNQLLNAYECRVWSELPHDVPYLWDHIAEHLIDAGRIDELAATVKDGRYLVAKTFVCDIYALQADLNIVEQHVPTDTTLRLLKRSVTRMGHLLTHCKTQSEVAIVLYGRLMHLHELSDVYKVLEQELPRPYLIPWHPFPDLEHSALIRIMQGHTSGVNDCAISPTGDFIVSASFDKTLTIWDMHSGIERLTLTGHSGGVNGCAISPTGDFIVSASFDKTLKIWDVHSGVERLTLSGHSGGVNGCAISP
ncbi:MAG: TIR domain-containing protein, partial [Ktedonobacteraceae bacterium]